MRRAMSAVLVMFLLLSGSQAWGQFQAVSVQWQARYSGPGNYYDEFSAMAVDEAGCSTLTGYTYGNGTDRDFVTVQYDAQGYRLWEQRYNGTGNNQDVAVAVAVDAWGNAVVCGYSFGSGTNYDIAMVKYDTAGNELWSVRYNGVMNTNDYPTSVAVDQQGNVYVTGYVQVFGTGSDCVTVKYDTNGVEQWAQRFRGQGFGYHSGCAIGVDSSGQVLVCGYSDNFSTGRDYLTLKYNPDGVELWRANYTGPNLGYDEACALIVDAEDNVYVTGRSYGLGTGTDCVTVKYNGAGQEDWARRYSGPASGGDQGLALALDGQGGICVGGISQGYGAEYDYLIIKYQVGDGAEEWVKRYGAEVDWNAPVDIGVDAEGGIYLCGESVAQESGLDYLLLKYDRDGRAQWLRLYDGPANEADSAMGMGFDQAGYIYVSGMSRGSGTQEDMATVKFDANGKEQWVARYNGAGISDDEVQAMVLDEAGNVYVSGYVRNGLNYDFATVKYDKQGQEQWRRLFGEEQWNEQGQAMGIDSAGNVCVTGFRGSRCVTVKYDDQGHELWAVEFDGADSSSDYAYALAIDSHDNILVGGYSYRYGGGGNDYLIIKYNPEGVELWTAGYNGPSSGNDRAFALVTDGQDNVLVSGYSYGSGTSYDYATVKFDAEGNQLWSARYNGTGYSGDYMQDMTVDEAGNVYITGYVYNSGTGRDYATVKYNPDGVELWSVSYDGGSHGSDYGQAVLVDDWGDVYVTGYSYGSGTGYDITTVKYDSEGTELWAAYYNDPINNGDYAQDMALDMEGNVYVTGYSYANGLADYLTIKYTADANEVWVARYDGPSNTRDDIPQVIAVDERGDVYVSGVSGGVGTDADFVTVKYAQLGLAQTGQPRQVTIKKLKVKAGKREPGTAAVSQDKFELWGTFDATVGEVMSADFAYVTLWNQEEIIFRGQVPFEPEKVKRGIYRVAGEKGGITLFRFDLLKRRNKQPDFRIEAGGVDLTGLSSPVIVEIEIGDYYGVGIAGEDADDYLEMGQSDTDFKDNINGPRGMPMCLMLGYADALRVDWARVHSGKRDGLESLNVRGALAVQDRAVDLNQEQVTVWWGEDDFVETIEKGDLFEYQGKYIYRSRDVQDESGGDKKITWAIFDLQKCTFLIVVEQAEIISQSGTVLFGISFGSFSETDRYALEKKKVK